MTVAAAKRRTRTVVWMVAGGLVICAGVAAMAQLWPRRVDEGTLQALRLDVRKVYAQRYGAENVEEVTLTRGEPPAIYGLVRFRAGGREIVHHCAADKTPELERMIWTCAP